MNKDELQLCKATIKMKYIKKIIDLLQELNLIEEDSDLKTYNIVLDYYRNSDENFTTFKISIEYTSLQNKGRLFDFNFKLKDEKTGFKIFNNIRKHFLENDDLEFSAFKYKPHSKNGLKFSNHHIITNHHVNLYSIIHDKNDEDELLKFQYLIDKKYNYYKKRINYSNLSKDEIQITKALKKKELVYTIIDMLHDLSDLNTNNKSHYYRLELEYSDIVNDCYRFDIKVYKDEVNTPFNINFKLNNLEKGAEILNDIGSYFINVNNCTLDYYHNPDRFRTSYECVGINENVMTKLTYNVPTQDFNKIRNTLGSVVKEQNNKQKIKEYK